MTISGKYLETLKEREPGLFSGVDLKSTLTQTDLCEIEHTLGYILPNQYKEFLLNIQLPQIITVCISLCGESSSYWDTFSRKQNCYTTRDGLNVLVDLNWYGIGGTCASDWIDQIKKLSGEMSDWLNAGYIQLADFHLEDYFVFYDLTTGEVLKIHNEDMSENEEFLDAWTRHDSTAIRTAMNMFATGFCRDFNTFLRLVCLGEVYDEDKMTFVTE